jgi:hypothetical protein
MWLGRQWTTAEVVQDLAIGHARGHLEHILAAAANGGPADPR